VQDRASRPSGGVKTGGRTAGIKKQHGPAQVIASDSAALWSRRAKTNWRRESTGVRWAVTAAQVSSPRMGLNRLVRVHFPISRFITPNRVRRHRRRLQANASRLGGGNVPNPSRFQAITIWTTEWDATCPNFMSDGFRPETYPLWTAERPAVHQRSRKALHHRGSLVQRVRRRAALRLEVQRPPQLTAFFTSAPILTSSVAVNSFSAKATGHTVPSSRFALSLKPNVAYLALNLCALWKKQTTLPSLA